MLQLVKMLDLRNVLVYIILVVCFSLYLHSIVSNYLRYGTVTTVGSIINVDDYEPIKYSICIGISLVFKSNFMKIDLQDSILGRDDEKIMSNIYGSEYLDLEMNLNGVNVTLSDPFRQA